MGIADNWNCPLIAGRRTIRSEILFGANRGSKRRLQSADPCTAFAAVFPHVDFFVSEGNA
jgi:hypothetical protein